MLFNSYEYIFLFLPISLIVYFILNRQKYTIAAKIWLIIASLVFYGWWNPIYIPLIGGSIAFNYFVGLLMLRAREKEPFNISGVC
jgi:alginate O-acetyltransferase complex protein AlgI